MDFTQNKRLSKLLKNTIIIGVDVAKYKHVARAVDDRWSRSSKTIVTKIQPKALLS